MADEFDSAKLAEELARIASATMDSVTGMRLMAIAHRLLTVAGLPEPEAPGDGEPPPRWSFEPVCGRA